MKSTVFSGISLFSLGLLLVLPSETSQVAPVDRPFPRSTETLVAQCRSGRTGNARGPQDVLIPYLISPRNTALLSDRPSFRWNAPAEADRYTVTLLNGETALWSREVNTNQLAYPAEADALQPGIDYRLRVEASNGRSSQEDSAPDSFRLLSAAEIQAVNQAEALLAAQPATEATAILKAHLYSGATLYADAIATLDALITQGEPSAIAYRQVGNLYAQSGLVLFAENRYLKAASLATADLAELAIVQAALGNLYESMGEEQEAIRWLSQARETYTSLGNAYQIKVLDEQLRSLGRA